MQAAFLRCDNVTKVHGSPLGNWTRTESSRSLVLQPSIDERNRRALQTGSRVVAIGVFSGIKTTATYMKGRSEYQLVSLVSP